LTAIALLGIQPIFAGAPFHLISITETSPISLLVTYDGSAVGITVNSMGSDQWDVTLPTSVHISPLDIGAWKEPENANLLNIASLPGNSVLANLLHVVSDSSVVPEAIPMNDGAFITMGFDDRDQMVVAAVFHDTAAIAENVPDPGSTVALFSLSLLALFGASRLRAIRLV
jgi:hypothetical protein